MRRALVSGVGGIAVFLLFDNRFYYLSNVLRPIGQKTNDKEEKPILSQANR
jgi:hypothetical protein